MDISAIIVNWNTKDLLVQCILSLKKSGFQGRLEILVVDNGSQDGSVEFIREHFPEVCLIPNKENLGFAKANNLGIQKSSGRYLCFVNSDVVVLGDCLAKLCDFMDQHPSVGIVGPRVLKPDLTVQDSCRKFPSPMTAFCDLAGPLWGGKLGRCREHMTEFAHDKLISVDSLVGCFLFVRRQALEESGCFDERFFIYSEETDLCRRFRDKGWEIVFSPDASIIHHHGASSSKDPGRFFVELYRSKIKYWKKHHSLPRQAAFLLFFYLYHISRILGFALKSRILPPGKREGALLRIKAHRKCMKLPFALDSN